MIAPAVFLEGLSSTWKALMALSGAVAVGVAIGAFLVGFTQVPEQMESVERQVRTNTRQLAEMDRKFAALVCLMTLPNETSRERAIRECGI